jgi:hypothetical protein
MPANKNIGAREDLFHCTGGAIVYYDYRIPGTPKRLYYVVERAVLVVGRNDHPNIARLVLYHNVAGICLKGIKTYSTKSRTEPQTGHLPHNHLISLLSSVETDSAIHEPEEANWRHKHLRCRVRHVYLRQRIAAVTSDHLYEAIGVTRPPSRFD